MTTNLSIAQNIGRGHLLNLRNCQDAVRGNILGDSCYGIVCDGCSEGKYSEVGANLAATFLSNQIKFMLKADWPVERIPKLLHQQLLLYMNQLLSLVVFESPAARVDYIKNHLLFTVIGFVYTPVKTVIFAQGDGVIVVDDQIIIRDENDRPQYIGYRLVDRKYMMADASPIQDVFDMMTVPDESFSRLAIASDALISEQDIIPQLWNNPRVFSLQKKVNVWSEIEHRFRDDVSIVVLEKMPKQEEEMK